MAYRIATALSLLFVYLGSAQTDRPKNPLARLSDSIRDLTSHVAPAVVEIIVTGYVPSGDGTGQASNRVSRQSSSGSGVLVDAAGYIMTNAHVVQGAVRIRVVVPGLKTPGGAESSTGHGMRVLEARILGIDRESDLALIKVDAQGLAALRFGDSDKISQGDLVFAIGSPLGLRNSVSMGVVSSPARAVSDDNPILYIQTDASINPGNSGGALVDTQGALMGMSTFIMSQSGGNEGIGFAIPGNVVQSVYQQLRRGGRVSRGFVGIQVQDITPELAEGLRLAVPRGVLVADMDPGGPAEAAGIQRRDVILSVNGQAIETARQLENDVYRRQGGDKLGLTIMRGAERISLTVEVQERATPWDPLAALASPEKNLVHRLGILCIEIDRQVAQLMPELRRQYGLLVVAKSPEGQAQFIDLQPGDVIHAINNLSVVWLPDFQSTVQGLKPGDAVVLQIERDQRFQYVAFVVE